MSSPGDAAARERALDPAGSFIVEAPAGSGKTELLTQRLLRLLAHVDRPEEILAITFTRKAAGEMRVRVLTALESARDRVPVAAAHQQHTRDLAKAALARDRDRRWALLDNPTRLRVMTIDGLNAWLAQRLPVLGRLGGGGAPAERPKETYRAAARRCLLALDDGHPGAAASRRLLVHLDNRFSLAEDLLLDLLARRDHWLPRIGPRPGAEDVAVRASLEAALTRATVTGLERAKSALAGFEAVGPLAAMAAEALAADGRSSPIAACRNLAGLPPADASGLPAWQGLAHLLLVKGPAARKRYTVREGVARDRREEKAALLGLAARLSESEESLAALDAVRHLPGLAYDNDQWQVLTALLDVLRYAAAELELEFRRRRTTDFLQIAGAARAALGPPDSPTDLALLVDMQLRHILVDEFQDTSEGQHELLRRLTAGWTPGDGRTLFCVGDPMQSIYRFRDADVGLFLRAAEDGVGGLPLERLTLTTNFRSRRELVAWSNETFSEVFPGHADTGSGAVVFTPAEAARADSAPVPVTTTWAPADETGEANLVADLVSKLVGAEDSGTIAVLVRSRTHLRTLLPALRARGLRFRGVDIQPLGETPVVQGLLALTRAICHPADRVAWLACLRAPWCGLPLEALAALPEGTGGPRALRDAGFQSALDEESRVRVNRHLLPVLARAVETRGHRPLSRVVESAWLALGGPATVASGASLDDARTYLAFLAEAEAGGDVDDPVALEEAIEDLYAAADTDSDGRLQVMTIHKAKGLEFDHVVLPGLDRGVRPEASPLVRWAEWIQDGRADLLMAPLGRPGEEPDPIHAWLGDLEKTRAAHERARLLYVAVTRARQSLHLVARARRDARDEMLPPRAGSFLAMLAPVMGQPDGSTADGAAAPVGTDGPLRRLRRGWSVPDPPAGVPLLPQAGAETEDGVEYLWAGRVARIVGTVVHGFLEDLGRLGFSAWAGRDVAVAQPLAEIRLAEAGLSGSDATQALEQVLAALEQVAADPRAAWLFDPGHRWAASEYALTTVDGQGHRRVVVDRVFEDRDGIVWIVDFKTGGHAGGGLDVFLDREVERHRAQLETYGAAMAARRKTRSIRLALYFPLLGAWREWPAS